MKQQAKLSTSMTLAQFDNGYWYTSELKAFAKSIGIAFANRLRKDQLEHHIKRFLESGEIYSPKQINSQSEKTRDVDLGLSLRLPVVVYTNDKRTKDFLQKEAQKMAPGLRRKSGARYRLNRWREEKLNKGVRITYEDLVLEYIRLNQTEGPFDAIPQDRYVDFLSDFLKNEKGATREQGIKAWKELKTLDYPQKLSVLEKVSIKEKVTIVRSAPAADAGVRRFGLVTDHL